MDTCIIVGQKNKLDKANSASVLFTQITVILCKLTYLGIYQHVLCQKYENAHLLVFCVAKSSQCVMPCLGVQQID